MIVAIAALSSVAVTLFLYIKQLHRTGRKESEEMTNRLITVITQTNSSSQNSVNAFNTAIKSFESNTTKFSHTLDNHTDTLKEFKSVLHEMNEKLTEIKFKK